jgi:T4 RnlA family RNA ligase
MKNLFNFIKDLFNKKRHDLPNYDECVAMCNKKNSTFYEVKTVVDGYRVSLFNYRLANNSDFNTIHSREMRGLCFVFNLDGSLFKRYILLEKFFNLNQTESTNYDKVKNYKIKFVNNKEDGSIASFIMLPNGKVVGKSKMGFDNDQASGINRVYRSNPAIKKFVDNLLETDIVPIFEYVAPTNRIVLRYNSENLILLKLRCNKTGLHLPLSDFDLDGIDIAKFENCNNLDELLKFLNVATDKEGVIVQTEDNSGKDFFFKIKTPWYISLHGILTEDVFRENRLISYILDEKVDDVLGQLPEEDSELRNKILSIMNLVKNEISHRESDILDMWNIFVSLDKNKKEFAQKYLAGNQNAALALRLLKGVTAFDLSKEVLREKTKKLSDARNWLESKDKNLIFNSNSEE